MRAQELEKEAPELPTINPWRRRPSREQVRFAIDLCRSELPYGDRVRTVASFSVMDSSDISELIDQLKEARQRRLARLRGKRRRR